MKKELLLMLLWLTMIFGLFITLVQMDNMRNTMEDMQSIMEQDIENMIVLKDIVNMQQEIIVDNHARILRLEE